MARSGGPAQRRDRGRAIKDTVLFTGGAATWRLARLRHLDWGARGRLLFALSPCGLHSKKSGRLEHTRVSWMAQPRFWA